MIKTIDLNYVKKEQEKFLEHLKSIEGIKYQESKFGVPMWLTLAILSELVEVLNETKIHKWWDLSYKNNERVLEELTDLLSHLGNMANLIDSKMIISINITQTRSLEKIFVGMGLGILSTSFSKRYVRTKFPQLLQNFIELVYSLGFNMDEIKEAYFIKMSENYLRFI